jgi:ABC-2 type transport system permease protein
MAVGYLLYFGAVLFVTLAVSAVASSARFALVTLCGFWIMTTLLLPRAAADLADRLYPSPSAAELWSEIHKAVAAGIDGHDPADARRKALEAEVLRKHGVTRVEDLPVNFDGIALQAGEEYGNGVYDRVHGRLWDGYAAQERILGEASLAAPVLAARSLSMEIAGTGLGHQRDFLVAAEAQRRAMQRQLNGYLADHSKTGESTFAAGRELWEAVPAFDYRAPGLRWAIARQRGALTVLAAWLLAGAAAALLTARRVKP